jgi:hypothetical protein
MANTITANELLLQVRQAIQPLAIRLAGGSDANTAVTYGLSLPTALGGAATLAAPATGVTRIYMDFNNTALATLDEKAKAPILEDGSQPS